jgi:hypothetical protein
MVKNYLLTRLLYSYWSLFNKLLKFEIVISLIVEIFLHKVSLVGEFGAEIKMSLHLGQKCSILHTLSIR